MPVDVTWLPYVDDRHTLAPGGSATLQIAEDPAQGLGVAGRSGKIENLGPGVLVYQVSDNGERWSEERSLQVGGWDAYSVEERVRFYTIALRADALGCVFNVIMTAKAPDFGSEL